MAIFWGNIKARTWQRKVPTPNHRTWTFDGNFWKNRKMVCRCPFSHSPRRDVFSKFGHEMIMPHESTELSSLFPMASVSSCPHTRFMEEAFNWTPRRRARPTTDTNTNKFEISLVFGQIRYLASGLSKQPIPKPRIVVGNCVSVMSMHRICKSYSIWYLNKDLVLLFYYTTIKKTLFCNFKHSKWRF